jgi:hypothetical protein
MKFAFHGLLFCALCAANDLLAQRDTFIKELLCLQSVNTNEHCVLCMCELDIKMLGKNQVHNQKLFLSTLQRGLQDSQSKKISAIKCTRF